MIAMNNSLNGTSQQRMQNDTSHALQAIHQSQWDHANDSLIDDISTFDGNLNYIMIGFWSEKNIAAVTKQNPKELALEKAQGTVIKCLKSLPADASWNNLKGILRQQFSLVPIVIHAATWLMHRYQHKGQSLQECRFEFSELIQAVTNCEPRDSWFMKDLYLCAKSVQSCS